ncbi:MAG: hypothetical protein JNL39_09975 [Opitutaceae bacterium]|nr:hypothetical protein [Opitutaceae bacterium]
MPNSSPKSEVGSKCIAYTEALLRHRRSVLTDDDAIRIGRELFAWFESSDGLAEDHALLASRSIDLGITLLQTSTDTVDRISSHIRETFRAFVSG